MSSTLRRLLAAAAVALVGIFVVAETFGYASAKRFAEDEVRNAAEHVYGVLMATRRVYHRQFVESGLELNDTTLGFLPAHAMARVSKEVGAFDASGFTFNNVSDLPRNPGREADAIEREAMAFFRAAPQEPSRFRRVTGPDGVDFYHYARPIWIEPYCLTCHGPRDAAPETIRARYDTAFDYKVGDLRGVLSLRLPATTVDAQVRGQVVTSVARTIALVLALAALMTFVVRREVTRPLAALRKGVEAMKEEGLTHRVPPLHGDLNAASEAINAMADRILAEQTRTEASLRVFRAVSQVSSDAIIVTDGRGAVREWNPAAERMFGWSAAEVVGDSLSRIMPAAMGAEHEVRLASRAAQPGALRVIDRALTITAVRRSGEEFTAEVTLNGWDHHGEPRFVGIIRDVTERARAEAQWREAAATKLAVARLLQRTDRALQDRLGAALDVLLGLQGVEPRGALFVAEQARLRLLVQRGPPVPCVAAVGGSIDLGQCLCGQAARTREPRLCASHPDPAADGAHAPGAGDLGHYTLPLLLGDECLGVMTLYTQHTAWSSPSRLETIREVADLMAVAIANERAVEAVKAAAAQAESATRAKSNFLANMSHEIRTPMNAVLGLSRMGVELERNDETSTLFGEIHRASTNLLGILNDLLDYSKLEAGHLRVEPAAVDLRELLDDVRSLYAPVADEKRVALVFEVSSALPPRVLADALRLRQVLSNLVSNALKFTAAGEVKVVVTQVELEGARFLRFEVRDSGIGLSAEQRARLFQPFEQADGSISRRYGGTGLGLSISARLCELMGARIDVESNPGQGACFTVLHPLVEATGSARDVPPSPVSDPDRLRGLRVLLAEDNAVNQYIAVSLLRKLGAEVEAVPDGSAALAALAARSFDVVLMDLQMPVMDGIECTRRVRADARLRHQPIIALTASAMIEDRQACRDAGMDDFVSKPLQRAELIAALERVVA